eukprot:TRINITY_DN6127_c0_g1_i1.p1 TRINITY_DN6127_c0_g1~~TRINITY_DN6127_c0_g1_i1.p1  ORF type:complete len:1116 (+),score=233.49 TRINITY_DN6127_c0_g1_i1:29-3376(+)
MGIPERQPDRRADCLEALASDPAEGMKAPEGALVPFDDGQSEASARSDGPLAMALRCADPEIAAGTAVFGLGLLVLPLLSMMRLGSRHEQHLLHSYSACEDRGSTEARGAGLASSRELQQRFGELDAAALQQELAMDAEELRERVKDREPVVLENETRRLAAWRDRTNGQLRLLERRAALAFLGLATEASDDDIHRIYKRLALELHPDKGGDPGKFQELQEMKERLSGSAKLDFVDDDDVDDQHDTDGTEQEDGSNPESDKLAGKNLDDEEVAKLQGEAQKLRVEMHESAVRIWERACKVHTELTSKDASRLKHKLSSQPLNALRTYIQRFVSRDLASVRDGDAAACEVAVSRFVNRGAEVLVVAAATDLQATLATLSIHFNHAVRAKSRWAPVAKRSCDRLVQAVSDVPQVVQTFLRKLQAQSKDVEASAQQSTEDEAPPKAGSRKSSPGFRAKMNKVFGQRRRSTAVATRSAGEITKKRELLVFEPPPMPCGTHELRLRLAEATDGLEDLQASLWNNAGLQVASLTGAYLLRGEDDGFLDACAFASAPEQLKACATELFDARGRPKPSLAEHCGIRARTAGLVWLSELRIVGHLLGQGLETEFVGMVLRCLAGPMKRVTLCISTCATEWTQGLGFRGIVAAGKELWLWEAASSRQRPGLASPQGSATSAAADTNSQDTAAGTSNGFRNRWKSASANRKNNVVAATVPETRLDDLQGPGSTPPETPAASSAQPSPEMPKPCPTPSPTQPAPAPEPGGEGPGSTPPETPAASSAQPSPEMPKPCPTPSPTQPAPAPEPGGEGPGNTPPETPAASSAQPSPEMPKPCPTPSPTQPAPSPEPGGEGEDRSGRQVLPAAAAADAAAVHSGPGAGGADGFSGEGLRSRLTSMPPPRVPVGRQKRQSSPDLAEPTKRRLLFIPPPGSPPGLGEARNGGCGTLTPRARFALAYAAAFGAAMLRADAAGFQCGRRGTGFWGFQSLPGAVQQTGVYKSFLMGMAEVVDLAGSLLRQGQEGLATAISAVLCPASGLPKNPNRHKISHFFGRGGSAEHVLRALCDEAEAFSELCEEEEGDFDAAGAAFAAQWAECYRSLPLQMLDGDFEFVRRVVIGTGEHACEQ